MRKSERIIKIEKEYGMTYKEVLEKLYIEDKMSIPQISKKLNCDSGNLSKQFKKLGIQTRKGKEVFDNWWNNASDKERESFVNNSKNIANAHLQTKSSRDKLREVMQTNEYKRKMSKTKIGTNNGRYKESLSEMHRVKTRGIFGYKKWSKQVRERDDYTCKICGKTKDDGYNLVAHHLDSYDTHKDLRLDLDNGVTLCVSCHNKFHNKYKGEKTTRKQFYKYLSDMHL